MKQNIFTIYNKKRKNNIIPWNLLIENLEITELEKLLR